MAQFYCTVRGTISPGTWAEIFQHSIAVTSTLSQSAVADAVELSFRNAFGTTSTKLASIISNSVTYTEVTAAQIIRLDGTPPDALMAATHKPFSPQLVGGNSGGLLPPQNSVAISLVGGVKPNGAPYKGRFYLPPITPAAVTSAGLLVSANKATLTSWAAEWLNALRAAGCDPAVWSRSNSTLSSVGQIRVGDKVDTIRSRRNKGVETYSAAVIT
jgi:hypothetical protein